jgi:hypothetical protein
VTESGTSFSDLQAVVQAWHPMHFVWSTTLAQRGGAGVGVAVVRGIRGASRVRVLRTMPTYRPSPRSSTVEATLSNPHHRAVDTPRPDPTRLARNAGSGREATPTRISTDGAIANVRGSAVDTPRGSP